MNNPNISVCIPVFNGVNFIKESIDSVLNQTIKNFELIIVDNCSADSTIEIVEAYNDPRIKLFRNEKNLGLFGNWNKCIEVSNGVYIVILPHDDLIESTMIEKLSTKLSENKECGLAYSSYYQVNPKSEKINFVLTQPEDKIMNDIEAFEMFIHTCPIQCCMVKKEVYENIGLFTLDLPFTGDVNMWCRIALAGYKVVYLKEPQNSIRIHEHQTTTRIYAQGEYGSQLYDCYRKIFEMIPSSSNLQKLRTKAAIWPMKVEIVYMAKFLLSRNIKSLNIHIKIFGKICRWIGIFRASLVFLSVFPKLLLSTLFSSFKKKVHKKTYR